METPGSECFTRLCVHSICYLLHLFIFKGTRCYQTSFYTSILLISVDLPPTSPYIRWLVIVLTPHWVMSFIHLLLHPPLSSLMKIYSFTVAPSSVVTDENLSYTGPRSAFENTPCVFSRANIGTIFFWLSSDLCGMSLSLLLKLRCIM